MASPSTTTVTAIPTLSAAPTKPANIADAPNEASFDLPALSAQIGALSTYLCVGGGIVGKDELKLMFPGNDKPFAIKWQPELTYLVFVLPPMDELENGCYIVEPAAAPLSTDKEHSTNGLD